MSSNDLTVDRGNWRAIVARWVPTVATVLTAGAGFVNILSTLTPNAGWGRGAVMRFEPVEYALMFHAITLPVAAALLVISIYLARRRAKACQIAVYLLTALGVLNLLKGFDVEEASICWLLAFGLWSARDSFFVQHDVISLREIGKQVVTLVCGAYLTAVTALVGFDMFSHSELSFTKALRDSLDLRILENSQTALTEPVWLTVAVSLVGVGLLFASAFLLFRPLKASRELPSVEDRQTACRLVERYGSDSLSFFKLRQDKFYLFSPDREAFIGYQVDSRVLLVSGDPVGKPESIPALITELRTFADIHGLKIGVVGASKSMLLHYQEAGLRSLYVGDEAFLKLGEFSLEGRPIRKVRQSVNRLRKLGYSEQLVALGDLSNSELTELESVSDSQLDGGRERGFAMCMDNLRGGHQAKTLVLVARDGDGVAQGFLHFVPTSGRRVLSMSLMRRRQGSPNGLNEFMIASAAELLKGRGVEEISLNFAAFARWMNSPVTPGERLMGRLIGQLNPYFQMDSLYRFNSKFFPEWRPRYLCYDGSLSLPRTSITIMQAEGQLPRLRPLEVASSSH